MRFSGDDSSSLQKRIGKSHALRSPIVGWFTEGFATPDLTEAESLLRELSQELN